MTDLKLGDNHDIVFENGDFQLTRVEDESLAQRLRIKLLTIQPEWYLNQNEGLPYFTSIFGKPRAKESIDLIFKQAILEEPEVIQIKSFQSSIDSRTRQYSLNFTVLSEDGNETIPVELSL